MRRERALQSCAKQPKPAAQREGLRSAEEVQTVTMLKRRATIAKSKLLEGL